MPTNKDTPAKGRQNVPLYIMLPPKERDRLVEFAASIDRPLSWTVRDALRVYLDAVKGHAAKLAAPDVDMNNAGKTKQARRGRPRKKRD
jgi:predicted transcriptional regulator